MNQRNSPPRIPLAIRRTNSLPDMAEYLMEMATRINVLDDHVMALNVNYINLAGEVSNKVQQYHDNSKLTIDKLTDIIGELRDTLIPDSEYRKGMITLPKLEEAIRRELDEKELETRRQNSIRVRATKDEKARDTRIGWIAFYGLLASGIAIEFLRFIISGHF